MTTILENPAVPTPSATEDAVATHEVESQIRREAKPTPSTSLTTKEKARLEASSKKKLVFLKDPYTIAQAVEQLLDKNKFDEALYLARLASKSYQVVVSWNHLIAYLLDQGKLQKALLTYQEMKKRAQLPNSRTYTIIFSGCARLDHVAQAMHPVTRIYYSMLASDRLQPNTIHMNAVLEVCSRARDMEALFNIAKTANSRTRMPDSHTYTTILNALRYSTMRPHHRSAQGDEVDVSIHLEKASVSIARARAVWEEIVTNWRLGRVVLDETVVCAMGRVLLMGTTRDNDDVLSLVEQAMGIPRLDRQTLPPPPAETKKVASAATLSTAAQDGKGAEASAAFAPDLVAALQMSSEEFASTMEPAVAKPVPAQNASRSQFTPLAPGIVRSRHESIEDFASSKIYHARPGKNVLSLILTSIGSTRKTTLAPRYWDVLTSEPYSVVPDSENYYRLLRALERGHASTKATEMVLKMPKNLINEKTLQMAMGICYADALNEHAFASAGKILDLMSQTLSVPDPLTMRRYLETAVANNRHFRERAGSTTRGDGKFEFGRQLVRALRRMWDPLRLVSNATLQASDMTVPAASQAAQKYNAKREVIALARRMVSIADMVVTEGMADEATIKDVRVSRNLLNRQVTRFYEAREDLEPKLSKSKKKVIGQRRKRDMDGQQKRELKEDNKIKKAD